MLRRDVPTLKTTAGELLQLVKQYDASYWALWAKPMLGWIAAQEGNIETGIRQMHESAAALQKQKANLWVPQTLLLEAEILGNAMQYQHAYTLLDAAQELIEPLDQRFYEAELHRVRGAVLIADKPDSDDGIANVDRAIEVARRQSSRFLELLACVSKARAWRDRGFRNEAREGQFITPSRKDWRLLISRRRALYWRRSADLVDRKIRRPFCIQSQISFSLPGGLSK
jgi:predicted ATPase